MTVEITNETNQRVKVNTDVLNLLFKKALDLVNLNRDLDQATISLVFVDNQKIQEYNKKYRQKDSATDVLSFSYLDEEDDLLGESIISLDTAQRQAEQQNHSLEQEIEVLFVHSVLHILGFDHETDSDKEKMLDLEQKLLGDKAGLISRVNTE